MPLPVKSLFAFYGVRWTGTWWNINLASGGTRCNQDRAHACQRSVTLSFSSLRLREPGSLWWHLNKWLSSKEKVKEIGRIFSQVFNSNILWHISDVKYKSLEEKHSYGKRQLQKKLMWFTELNRWNHCSTSEQKTYELCCTAQTVPQHPGGVCIYIMLLLIIFIVNFIIPLYRRAVKPPAQMAAPRPHTSTKQEQWGAEAIAVCCASI